MKRHLVTDRRRFGLDAGTLTRRVAAAAVRGVDFIQVREPDLDDRTLVALVRGIVEAVRPSGARVLVNDRLDVAIAGGAAGVHLRADSVPASRVRAIVREGFVIGRSLHSLLEVDEAVRDGGCDYLLFGTVFSSAGKPLGHPVAGLDALAAACRRSPLPVVAIGGMSDARASEVEAAGAAGLAGVGMFM
jgi:thiamine-phosphate pyrophosphorylase